jgi:hypothetical protein
MPDDLAPAAELRVLTRLRRSLTPEQAGAVLALGRLRVRAAAKFGADAVRMFFTADALEQASDAPVRRYHATLAPPDARVLDVCCSIGSDGLAFAEAGCSALGIDLDETRALCAAANAGALGLSSRFHAACADAFHLPAWAAGWDAVFFDPARRTADGRRIFSVEAYLPPLSLTYDWPAQLLLAKLSPGVEVASLAGYTGGLEFISVDGDLKEALLVRRAGDAQPASENLAAVLLRDGQVLRWARGPGQPKPPSVLSEPRRWVIEPNAALIRAGLVRDAAAAWGGAQLDESIAYLTTDHAPDTPWARSFRVWAHLPFNVKQLRGLMREHDIGSLTVKKRGTAVTPEVLIPQLRLAGSRSATLFLTRQAGRQIAILCDDAPETGREQATGSCSH